MNEDLVTQIRQALEDRAVRIAHTKGRPCRLMQDGSMLCMCDLEERVQADVARAIEQFGRAAITDTVDHTEHTVDETLTVALAALRQEAP
jgi:hypothetical protein